MEDELIEQDVFIVPHSYSFDDFYNVVIGRWYVDNAFLIHTRTKNMPLIDGTIFHSYHLGTEQSHTKKHTVKPNDWGFNAHLLNRSLLSEGSLRTKELFCQQKTEIKYCDVLYKQIQCKS